MTRTAAALVLGVLALAASSFAQAAPPGPTRGDAEAVLRATLTGGVTLRSHNLDAQGAPLGFLPSPGNPRIHPLISGPTYCAAGWHVISLGLFDAVSSYPTLQALFVALDASFVQFTLDGVSLDVERTPSTSYTDPESFGVDHAFGVNFGVLMPPGSLTLGLHQLRTSVFFPGFPPATTDTTFTIVSC